MKQYSVQIKYKKHRPDTWFNAMTYDVNGGKQFASTLMEAERAIEKVREMWERERKGTKRVQQVGMIGITCEPIRDDTFEIVASRIRVREVTEWEVVKEA